MKHRISIIFAYVVLIQQQSAPLLKFKPMIKLPTVTGYIFFDVATFSNINSFRPILIYIHIYQL